MKLIDKDRVVAEIEKRIKETESMQPKFDQFWAGQISAFKGVLKILDTLEVKEVNLEKEIESWRHNHFHGRRDKEASGEYLERVSQLDLAKHFFELGIKAQKRE